MPNRVTIRGIEDVNRVLQEIAPREAKNLMRATVHEIAGQLGKDARELSPDDTGLLDKSIKHKRARGTREKVQSDVVVDRKAFYWRFLEMGRGPDRVEHAFFLRSLQAIRPRLATAYVEVFTQKLLARLARKARTGR
jgi:hypothetical protein